MVTDREQLPARWSIFVIAGRRINTAAAITWTLSALLLFAGWLFPWVHGGGHGGQRLTALHFYYGTLSYVPPLVTFVVVATLLVVVFSGLAAFGAGVPLKAQRVCGAIVTVLALALTAWGLVVARRVESHVYPDDTMLPTSMWLGLWSWLLGSGCLVANGALMWRGSNRAG